MKKDWEVKALGEVCTTSAGGTPLKSHKEYYLNGDIPWLRSGEVCSKYIDCSELFITNEGLKKSSAKLFPVDTVLVAMYGATAGQVGVLKFESSTNQAVCGILPNSKMVPEFLYYYFTYGKEKLVKQAVGGAQPNISQDKIKNTLIPVLPVLEQKMIVKNLDEKFEVIEKLRKIVREQLVSARELFESRIDEIFENVEGKMCIMSDICDLKNGFAFKSSDYVKSSNTFNIRMSNIRPGGQFDSEHNPRFLPDSYSKKYSDFLLNDGDLIIAMTDMAGTPKILAIPTLVKKMNNQSFLLNQRVGKLTDFSDDIYIPYLRYYLSAPKTRDYLQSKGVKGVQINLSKVEIMNTPLKLPNLKIQKSIVAELDLLSLKTRELEAIFQRKIAELEDLKKSYLHEAFSGKL
jgi:type I restriction enzyme S subunit